MKIRHLDKVSSNFPAYYVPFALAGGTCTALDGGGLCSWGVVTLATEKSSGIVSSSGHSIPAMAEVREASDSTSGCFFWGGGGSNKVRFYKSP